MRIAAACALLAAPLALADGDGPESARALREAESYVHELRRLHEADALLEVQLRIAKKLSECRDTGYPCPGLDRLAPARHAAGDPADPLPAPETFGTPRPVGVYQGRAQLRLDDGRRVEARPGQQLGRWRVRTVEVDAVQLEAEDGSLLRLPVEAP